MRLALSLFVVLVLARIASLAGPQLPASPLALIAMLWQDAAVALLVFALDRVLRLRWVTATAYAALVVLAAINVPVVRVLASPITTPMLRAARGTLADSILLYATAANIALIAGVLAVGAVLPFVVPRRVPGRHVWIGALGLLAVAGGLVAQRVDTRGLDRHPLLSLARTALPRVRARAADGDWRASPLSRSSDIVDESAGLALLRGAAAGSNVLLVVLESTGAAYLRPYGAAEDPTPNLTALAARSIVIDPAYAVYPESVKGLVSILASRYPGFDVAAEDHAAIASPSLASVLGERGYETALFHSGRFFYLGMEEILARSGFDRLDDAGGIGGNRSSSFGIDEVAAVAHILRWLDSLPRGRPFFAAYLPIAGHHPYSYTLPGPFSDHEDVGRYRNALHEGDAALGELLNGLRARGLDTTTIVVVVGDHGEAFGQHVGNFGHTLAIHEENIRVPFIVSLPGRSAVATRMNRTSSLLDVAPTVLDLLGVAVPSAFQGESAFAGDEGMALFFTDYSLGLLGLRDGCMKLIHELESGRSRLFDLCADPGERIDLARLHVDRVIAYRRRLREWAAAQVAAVTGPRSGVSRIP